MDKIMRLEKQMYKEIEKGNFDKADAIMKKIVALDVEEFAKRNKNK